jgi:hypothetical protein
VTNLHESFGAAYGDVIGGSDSKPILAHWFLLVRMKPM